MRGALIHGLLLVVMLVYGYRTWTRDKTTQVNIGSVVLWDHTDAELASLEYKTETKTVKLERRGEGADAYWWGTETTIEKKMKPAPVEKKPEDKAGSGSGSGSGSAAGSGSAVAAGSGSASGSGSAVAAGSGSGSGSAVAKVEPPKMIEEEVKKVKEFPLADVIAKDLIGGWAAARAQTELGLVDDAKKKEYKLDTAKTTVTVAFKAGGTRAFLIGGAVYSSADKYAIDTQSNTGYVLSQKLLSGLEQGEIGLHLTDPRGFEMKKLEAVVVEAAGKVKQAKKVEQAGANDQKVKVWGDAETGKGDQTLANFIDNINGLAPTEYAPNLKASDMQQIVKLTYKDDKGAQLGTLVLYKHMATGELPPGEDLDPANPPKGKTEFFIVTEKTRVPAMVISQNAERAEADVPTVFSPDHPTEAPVKSVDPKGNPFGKGPMPPVDPHGGPHAPGGAMPTPGAPTPAPAPAPHAGPGAPPMPPAPVPPAAAHP